MKYITALLIILSIPFFFPDQKVEATGATVTVNTENLTVRSGPSLQHDYVTTIYKGEQYPSVKKEGEWIQILLPTGKEGWVADYLVFVKEEVDNNKVEDEYESLSNNDHGQSHFTGKRVFITHNGTNIRKNPNTLSNILVRANKGDAFEVTDVKNDWYQVKLGNGKTGYVAEWLVTEKESGVKKVDSEEREYVHSVEHKYTEKTELEAYLKDKKIVIDPGHGGKDHGTTGFGGTLEKNITIETATRLYNKLRSAGAKVILTRYRDQYISLPSRVSASARFDADAFISIHYDSFPNEGSEGATTFFYHPWQRELAVNIHSSVIDKTNIHNRGVRKGDYYVIRENSQNAVLVELGFLSNPSEELLVTSEQYQTLATTGIYEGLARYFKNQY
ncbi:N-acetylmuramoyl-L-alanine amidase [Niallia sp. XMNu-256]|uniref:N-acetylmuramoyl-L-alanine amidase n=1 Tax=Niallia sp. XMNu-256 TaxID=3082444 RepID=UPI0030D266AF